MLLSLWPSSYPKVIQTLDSFGFMEVETESFLASRLRVSWFAGVGYLFSRSLSLPIITLDLCLETSSPVRIAGVQIQVYSSCTEIRNQIDSQDMFVV